MELRDLLDGLRSFLATTDEYLWIADPRVYMDGGPDAFHAALSESDADLLATEVRTRADDPHWHWWSTLSFRNQRANDPADVAVFLPLARFSRSAAEAVLHGWSMGWQGFAEALVPTLIARAGLKIEDIGSDGPFTPESRKGRWYNSHTWHWETCREHQAGKLHFPIPLRDKTIAPARIETPEKEPSNRLLFAIPAGGGAADLATDALELFSKAGADCLVLQYDDFDFDLPPDIRVIRDRGHKWQLAARHLTPATVASYDFIFFWDDDLAIDGFDPRRFARIMRTNRLSMAQPAIDSPHGLSHEITRRRPCPAPWRFGDPELVLPVVGRLTNFVEIMAPVFTRDGWREFYGYLDPGNRSGWGYDYVPLGRKGVVDVMPVIHTRPVQSIGNESERDIRRFLESQGLFRHHPVDQGWLFEHPMHVALPHTGKVMKPSEDLADSAMAIGS